MGKTSVIAWLTKTRGYPSHFIRRRDPRSSAEAVRRSLGAKVMDRNRGDLEPRSPDEFTALLERVAKRHSSLSKLVLLVNAVDEGDHDPGAMPVGMPPVLPRGVFVVATYRTGTRVGHPESSATLTINAADTRNVTDITQFVEAGTATEQMAARLALAGIRADQFVDQVVEACGGVWVYARYVLAEVAEGIRPADELRLPRDLTNYYLRYVAGGQETSDWAAFRLPLIATLAAAGEPLSATTLAHLAALGDSARIQRYCDHDLRPFLSVVTDTTRRYEIYHASLQEFLHGRFPNSVGQGDELQKLAMDLRQAATAAHGRIADQFLSDFGGLATGLPRLAADPSLADAHGGYGLRHLAVHLTEAGRGPDLHRLLGCEYEASGRKANLWYDLHHRTGTVDAYLEDVGRARRDAEAATDNMVTNGRPAAALGLEVRYALMTATVHSITNRIWPDLLVALVEGDAWSIEQALAHAHRLQGPAERFKALMALRARTPAELQTELLGAALTAAVAGGAYAPANNLTKLMPFLPAEMLGLAFAAVQSISDEDARGPALTAIAPYVPTDLLDDAVAVASEFESPYSRYQALGALAPRLSDKGQRDGILAEALKAAAATMDGHTPIALETLAPHLSEGLLTRAIAITNAIEDKYEGSGALKYLASCSPPELLPMVVTAAEKIAAAESAARVWTALAPRLPSRQRSHALRKALTAIRAIPESVRRFEALAAIAPHLPVPQQPPVLIEALELVPCIKGQHGDRDDRGRTNALLNLISGNRLSRRMLGRALEIAATIDDDFDRGRVMVALAPRLPPSLLGQALDAALPRRSYGGVQALIDILPHLPPDLLKKAVSIATGLESPHSRAGVLRAALIQPLLSKTERVTVMHQALSAARSISQAPARVSSLAALAPHLPISQRAAVLAEAAATAQAIGDSASRCHTLLEITSSVPREERPLLLREAIAAATTIRDGNAPAWALATMGSELLPDQVQHLRTIAYAAVTAINDESLRANALIGLIKVAPQLPPALNATVVEQALDSIAAIPDVIWNRSVVVAGSPGFERGSALERLAGHLTPDLLPRAVSIALTVKDDGARMRALLSLAPYLEPVQLRKVLTAVLSVSGEFDFEFPRNLASLVPYLPADLLADALTATVGIPSEYVRATALAGLAAHLPAALLDKAIEVAMATDNEYARAQALGALASRTPPKRKQKLLDSAFDAATAIDNKYAMAEALIGMMPNLTPRQRQTAIGHGLAAAHAVEDRYMRTNVLIELAGHLPPSQRTTVLRSAVQIARGLSDGAYARALADIAPSLSLMDDYEEALALIARLDHMQNPGLKTR